VAATDHVYSGDPGDGATGAAPPFTTGTMFFPITMQWRLGTSAPKDFPAKRQEHEIFSPGKCESRKGGENVSAMYTDPTGA